MKLLGGKKGQSPLKNGKYQQILKMDSKIVLEANYNIECLKNFFL